MNEEFKEEYWEKALKVLEREERLERRRKFLPWIFMGSIGGALVLAAFLSWYLPASNASHIVAQIDILTPQDRAINPHSFSNHTPQNTDSLPGAGLSIPNQGVDNLQDHLVQHQGVSGNYQEDNKDKRQAQMPQPSAASSQKTTPIANHQSSDSKSKKEVINTLSPHPVDPNSSNVPVGESMLAVGQPTQSHTSDYMGNQVPNLAELEKLDIRSNVSKLSPKTTSLETGVQAQIKFRGFEYHAPFPFKVDNFYLFAGNSFLTGFGSRKNELAFNPEIGLGYERVLAKRWSANASLSYFQIGGITHAAEFTETELGFGFNRTVTTIETTKLHFAYLPIMGNWDFNKRNALSLGIGVSFLINGLSEVTITEINDFSEHQISKTTDWGYTQGYRALNASLLAGYEFRLTSRVTFGVHYQYGLREITKANVYGHEFQDRNSRLRALIKYSFR